jgi:hypothetical protein
MMKIIYPEHCGNAPKKILLIDLYKAVAVQDDDFILNNLTDDAVLHIVGLREVVGKENVISAVNTLVAKGLTEIIIKDAITHGNTAAVYGSLLFKDDLRIDFCNIYVFRGYSKTAKIREIRSYMINLANHQLM